MRVIDSDSHVEESVETWRYLDPEFHPWRPIPVVFPEDTCFGSHNAGCIIDYKLRRFAASPTLMKRAKEKEVAVPVQEIERQDLPLTMQLSEGLPRWGNVSEATAEILSGNPARLFRC